MADEDWKMLFSGSQTGDGRPDPVVQPTARGGRDGRAKLDKHDRPKR